MRCTPLLFLAWLAGSSAYGQVTSAGTEFWLMYMENLNLQSNGPPSFQLVVSSAAIAEGEVQVMSTGLTIPFAVMADEPTLITLPNNIYYPEGDEDIVDFGLKIISDGLVDVQAYHHRPFFSEATLVHPRSSLGADYMVMAHADDAGNYPSEFVVLATEDGTTVRITPSALTLGFRTPGVPFEVELNAGQAFQLQAMGDLTGSRVLSLDPARPVAVFAGAQQAVVNCELGGWDDHLYQQLDPIERWGKSYCVVPFLGRGGDQVRLLGLFNDTQVDIAGQSSIDLDEGEVVDLNIDEPVCIRADKAMAVGQFNDSQDCNGASGDPAFLWLQPITRTDRRAVWSSLTGAGTPEHYINVVSFGESVSPDVFLDGTSISSSLEPLAGEIGVYSARIAIADGDHVLTSEREFQATSYGFGNYNSYAYHLGYDSEEDEVGIADHELSGGMARGYSVFQGAVWPAPSVGRDVVWSVRDVLGRSILVFADGAAPTVSMAVGNYVVSALEDGTVFSFYRLQVINHP